MSKCNIVCVGKSRNGTLRYWCTEHHAPASNGKGEIFERCLAKTDPIVETSENSLTIDPVEYPDGITLWGNVLPVYDTTNRDPDLGIFVRAGRESGKEKRIHRTFQFIHVVNENETVDLDYPAAISYVSASMSGHETAYIECPKCGYPHLDKDTFAVNPHRKHLCTRCGSNFYVSTPNIGNPVMKAKALLGDEKLHRKLIRPRKSISLKQSDYPYGISVWGSNTALLRTFGENEEYGIHIHAYAENSICPTIDETYDEVLIDGVYLDVEQVRTYMVQKTLPYLKGRVVLMQCPKCKKYLFESVKDSYIPHREHVCQHCGTKVNTRKKAIASPMEAAITELQKKTDLSLRICDICDFYPVLEGW